VLLLDAPNVVGVRAARRMPGIAQFERAPYGSLRTAANPDLGLRRGVRLRGRVVEGPVLPLEVVFAVPESAHQPERLVGAAAAALELDAHELELVLVPAHPDTEREAATRELLQRGDLLCQVHRVVQRHEHDRGAEPNSLRPASDPAERDERIVDAAVRIHCLGADDDVLGRPDRVEAKLLGGLDNTANAVGRRAFAIVRQDHPEVHDARLTAARVARLATTDTDGRPHLVPIVFALDGDTLYSAVDRKPKRSQRLRRIENARARPHVTILVDHYEENWGRLWWIRLRGRARILDRGEERERALTLLSEKYPQYRAELPEGPVLAVDVSEVREWTSSG
jgi:PPOX class probable F420-dependent enzyme